MKVNKSSKNPSQKYSKMAAKGYQKLAFGNTQDAIKLLFTHEPDLSQINTWDFFNISEIRRPKDGSMEIKFFDRLKALEKIQEMAEKSREGMTSFYRALEETASNINNSQDTEDNED